MSVGSPERQATNGLLTIIGVLSGILVMVIITFLLFYFHILPAWDLIN